MSEWLHKKDNIYVADDQSVYSSELSRRSETAVLAPARVRSTAAVLKRDDTVPIALHRLSSWQTLAQEQERSRSFTRGMRTPPTWTREGARGGPVLSPPGGLIRTWYLVRNT